MKVILGFAVVLLLAFNVHGIGTYRTVYKSTLKRTTDVYDDMKQFCDERAALGVDCEFVDCADTAYANDAECETEGLPIVQFKKEKGDEFTVVENTDPDAIDDYQDDLVTAAAEGLITQLTKKKAKKFHKNELPQVVLFSKGGKTSLEYQALEAWAAMFEGSLVFGVVGGSGDSKKDKKLLKSYGLSGTDLPALGMIPGYDEDMVDEDETLEDRLRRYTGPDDSPSVKAAFLGLLGKYKDSDRESVLPIPEAKDISCMKHHCINNGGLCAIVFATSPPGGVTPEVRYTLSQLEYVQQQRKDSLFSYVFVDTADASSADMMKMAFGASGADYPQLIVYSPRKDRFHNFVGAFNIDGVTQYLKEMQKGKHTTKPLVTDGFSVADALEEGDAECEELIAAAARTKARTLNNQHKKDSATRSLMRLQRGTGKYGMLIPMETTDDFDKIIWTPSHWMVYFEKEGEPDTDRQKEFERAAKGLRGLVSFAKVPANAEFAGLRENFAPLLSPEQKKGEEPYILYFIGGRDKYELNHGVALYKGSTSAVHMGKWAKEKLANRGRNLVERFDEYDEMTASLSANQMKPIIMLFTEQFETVPTMMAALATEFDEFATLAIVPADSDLAIRPELQINDVYPTLVVLKSEQIQDEQGRPSVATRMEPYKGPLNFNAIATTFLQLQQPFPRPLPDEELDDMLVWEDIVDNTAKEEL